MDSHVSDIEFQKLNWDFRRIWVLYISQFNPELHSQGRLMYGPEPRGEVVATYGFLLLPDLPICLHM